MFPFISLQTAVQLEGLYQFPPQHPIILPNSETVYTSAAIATQNDIDQEACPLVVIQGQREEMTVAPKLKDIINTYGVPDKQHNSSLKFLLETRSHVLTHTALFQPKLSRSSASSSTQKKNDFM